MSNLRSGNLSISQYFPNLVHGHSHDYGDHDDHDERDDNDYYDSVSELIFSTTDRLVTYCIVRRFGSGSH